MPLVLKQRSVLPGFSLTLGFTVLYLSLIVLIPLSSLFLKTATVEWAHTWRAISSPRVIHAFKLSFFASLAAALVNCFFGFAIAWMLVRYSFFGRRVIDAIVDLPFAMPTAVSGIALTAIYAKNGWVGQWLEKFNQLGWMKSLNDSYVGWIMSFDAASWARALLPGDLAIKVAYTPLGVAVALTFIGLPFVVRTLQPALQDLDAEIEEAAASLGASRWQTFRRIIVPTILPAMLTGFSLAFARALGEYGSVVFISANLPMKTQIAPQLIFEKLDQFDYAGATAIASVMLIASFFMLLVINLCQWWASRRQRGLT